LGGGAMTWPTLSLPFRAAAPGVLPGDMWGYWGTPDGFDFCERNYAVTYYIGELGCMMTNFVSLPIYFLLVWWTRRLAPSGRLSPATYVYLAAAFLDMFTAGMSHGTLRQYWTLCQEVCLAITFLTFVLVMAKRYQGCRFCLACVLISAGCHIVELLLGVSMELADVPLTPWIGYIGNGVSGVIMLCLVVRVLVRPADVIAKFFALQGLLLFFAFLSFGITDVHAGHCFSLPIWLHEAGHLLGAVSDYMGCLTVIGTDPRAQITCGFKGGLPVLRPVQPPEQHGSALLAAA